MLIDGEFWDQFAIDTGPVSAAWLGAEFIAVLVLPALMILVGIVGEWATEGSR